MRRLSLFCCPVSALRTYNLSLSSEVPLLALQRRLLTCSQHLGSMFTPGPRFCDKPGGLIDCCIGIIYRCLALCLGVFDSGSSSERLFIEYTSALLEVSLSSNEGSFASLVLASSESLVRCVRRKKLFHVSHSTLSLRCS